MRKGRFRTIMQSKATTGVLLVQLGTPDSPEVDDVRVYLKQFLSDPRVLDIPAPVRWTLLRTVILPFRPKRSAHAYGQIWTDDGSPLTLYTQQLARNVAERLGDGYVVDVGMRYRNPSIADAVDRLYEAGVERIVAIPMFPQYSSAATGSAVQEVLDVVGARWNIPALSIVGDFYDHPGFVDAAVAVARPVLDEFQPDHVLFSYHGLPEKQVKKSDPTGSWCLSNAGCCDRIIEANRFCYRAQAYATTRALAAGLGLAEEEHSTAFQSRLAGQKWIRPFTDKALPELYGRGVRRLAVLTPSFTADCLETLEEIGIRGRNQWLELGGEELRLVPCVNASPEWSDAVADMVTAS